MVMRAATANAARKRSGLRALVIAGISWLFMLAIAIPASLFYGIPVRNLTRDASYISNGGFYIGLISNLGIVLWAGSAAICFLAYAMLKERPVASRAPLFFLVSALFTLVMLGDDLMQLHSIIPEYFGIRRKGFLALYGLGAALYLYWFRAHILASDYMPLTVALTLFAISAAIDLIPGEFRGQYLLEDGAKFAGIATWFAYFFRLASDTLSLTTPDSEWTSK